MKHQIKVALLSIFMTGCAGFQRGCDSNMAESFGADWIIVQFDQTGKPFNCWKLKDTSVTNEPQSDGVYWTEGGNLVHISGWYNRVQVQGNKWGEAAVSLGVNLKACTGGEYVKPAPLPPAGENFPPPPPAE